MKAISRFYILAIILLMSSISANAMINLEVCELNNPLFTTSFEPTTITKQIQSIPQLDVSFESMLSINTLSSDITIRRIDFGILPNQNLKINGIVDQRITDSSYVIHVRAEFENQARKTAAIGNDVAIDGMGARVRYENSAGQIQTIDLCLPQLTLNVTGRASNLPEEAENRVNQLTSRLDTADKVRTLLGALNLISEFSCTEQSNAIAIKKTQFESSCGSIEVELRNIVLELEGATVANTCTGDDSSPFNPSNCNTCIELYNEITTMESQAQVSCQRLRCEDVITLDHFKETFQGDILGVNYCSEESESYDEQKCKDQYVLSEQPKCLFSDPLQLSEAASNSEPVFNPLGFLDGAFCSDRREPITIVKSPANDLFSSLSCGCLPGLLGWADLWYESIEMELECVRGNNNRNLSTCRSSLYTFSCDMIINSLTCGGLNLGPQSESARFLFNNEGDSISIEGLSPEEIRNHINDGYRTMLGGDATFNTGELIHSVCASAFGNADIDWSEVAMRSISAGSPQVTSLCPTGNVRGPCYCGSDLNNAVNNCGVVPDANYCRVDNDNPGGICVNPSAPVPLPDVSVFLQTQPEETAEPSTDSISQDEGAAASYPYEPSRSISNLQNLPVNTVVTVSQCTQQSNGVLAVPLSGPPQTLNDRGYDSSTATYESYKCRTSTTVIRERTLTPYTSAFYYNSRPETISLIPLLYCRERDNGVEIRIKRVSPYTPITLNLYNRGPDSSNNGLSTIFFCKNSAGNVDRIGNRVIKVHP